MCYALNDEVVLPYRIDVLGFNRLNSHDLIDPIERVWCLYLRKEKLILYENNTFVIKLSSWKRTM